MARMTIALEGWSEDPVCPFRDLMDLVQGLLTVLVTLTEECGDSCVDGATFSVESGFGALVAQISWVPDE